MSEEKTAIIVNDRQGAQALTANEIRAQVNLIQEVMQKVMQRDQHYGVIPGCKKPSLLKPGAEKLSLTFRLRPLIGGGDVKIEQLPGGHKEITVFCHILNSAGQELATGIGSCSSMENKYRYRGGEKKSTEQPVPREYWNLKNEGKLEEARELIGGQGFGVAKIDDAWQICELGEKAENPDIADTYNTVLKMAKKRAYIDGILSATAASDIFTQDIEDLPPETVKETEIKKPEVPPREKTKKELKREENSGGAKISVAQQKRLFTIAQKQNISGDDLHNYLRTFGIEHSKDIPKVLYDKICQWIENGGQEIVVDEDEIERADNQRHIKDESSL